MFRLLGMAKPEDEARKLMDSLRRDNVPFNEGAGYRLVRWMRSHVGSWRAYNYVRSHTCLCACARLKEMYRCVCLQMIHAADYLFVRNL